MDAIDTVAAKLFLAEYAYHHQIPLLSAMGAGNKLDPTQFKITDITKTSMCPWPRRCARPFANAAFLI